MWLFKKRRSISKSGLLQNHADRHCHVLPGVDDGISSMPESLRALEIYEKEGVTDLWLTPHVMEDTPNTPDKLQPVFQKLCEAYKGNIRLHLAAENMLDTFFDKRLKNDELLSMDIFGKSLLVEMSYFNRPMNLSGNIHRIKAKGYTPILAHPERYTYMEDEEYRALKEMDVKFQLNIFSLAGAYGHVAKKKAFQLLHAGMYDICGTDTHNARWLKRYLNVACLSSKDIELLKPIFAAE